jgi:hypothetical protein
MGVRGKIPSEVCPPLPKKKFGKLGYGGLNSHVLVEVQGD